jgi:signal transduction histidine kinase
MLVTATGPTRAALYRLVGRCAAALRAGSVAAAGVAAFVGLAPPASAVRVGLALAAVASWAAAYGLLLVTRGWSPWLLAGDVAVAAGLCLLAGRLVPSTVLADGSSWVFLIASTTVIISQLSPWPLLGVAAIGVVPLAYAGGVWLGGHEGPPWFAVLLVGQGAVVASMAPIVRRAGRAADAVLAEREAAERSAAVRAGRRAEEREHNRLLHDSVSATLTIVATGGLAALSPVLRRQAGYDLAVLDRLQAPAAARTSAAPRCGPAPAVGPAAGPAVGPAAGPAVGEVELANWLEPVLAAAGAVLQVEAVLPPVRVPARVAAALAGAVTEGLANVARHAGLGTARVIVTRTAGAGVLVEVLDAGRGFDPAAVPAHRRGLRESVVARLASIGGAAEIASRPGDGTRLALRWPAPGLPQPGRPQPGWPQPGWPQPGWPCG